MTDIFVKLTNTLNNRWDSFPLRVPSDMNIVVLKDSTTSPTKGVPEGTPAWCDYLTEKIYISATEAFGSVEAAETAAKEIIDFANKGSYGAPPESWDLLCGFLNHEISHARNSRWAVGQKMDHMDSVMMMEELHVEQKAVDQGGMVAINKLRKSFSWLLKVMVDQDNLPGYPAALAKMWALIVGRHLAGVVTWDEVEDVDLIVRSSLGDELIDQASEILTEATQSTKIKHREALGKEWDTLFPPPPEEMAIPMGCSAHSHEDPQDGDDGDGEGSGGKDGDKDGKAPGKPEDGEGEEGEGEGKTTAKGVIGQDDQESVSMIRGAIRATKEMVSERDYVDTRGLELAKPSVVTPETLRRELGNGWSEVPPTADDRANARKLARILSTLALPSITKEDHAAVIPPGRLRGRGAVTQSAQIATGQRVTAKPFKSTKRLRTTTKPVIVGCMTDTSGSMSWATEFIGHFTWVVGTAGMAIGARTAAVTYGTKVYCTNRPSERPGMVKIRHAWDSSEAFDKAAGTMDGLLKFRDTPNASKVLFIVSDGYYVAENEVEKCCLWTEALTKAGTTIVWVGAESEYSHYERRVHKPGAMRRIDVSYHDPDLNKLFNDMSKVIREAAAATR